jgi:hypothetical protein
VRQSWPKFGHDGPPARLDGRYDTLPIAAGPARF